MKKAVLVGKASVWYDDKRSCGAPVFPSFVLHLFLSSFPPFSSPVLSFLWRWYPQAPVISFTPTRVIIGFGVSLLCTTYTHRNLRMHLPQSHPPLSLLVHSPVYLSPHACTNQSFWDLNCIWICFLMWPPGCFPAASPSSQPFTKQKELLLHLTEELASAWNSLMCSSPPFYATAISIPMDFHCEEHSKG